MTKKYTIVLSDAHPILRVGIRALLGSELDLQVIGECSNAEETMRLCDNLVPDMLILELNPQLDSDNSVIRTIRRYHPTIRILVLTQYNSEENIRETLRAGANGYVLKDAADAELIMAVRTVLSGKTYLSPSISEKVIHVFLVGNKTNTIQTRWETLTSREREILKLIAEGSTSKYIAEHYGLSIKTIEKHRSNMMKKLGVHNVSALTSFAIGQGIVTANVVN